MTADAERKAMNPAVLLVELEPVRVIASVVVEVECLAKSTRARASIAGDVILDIRPLSVCLSTCPFACLENENKEKI